MLAVAGSWPGIRVDKMLAEQASGVSWGKGQEQGQLLAEAVSVLTDSYQYCTTAATDLSRPIGG